MARLTDTLDVLVVGAGQAGLALGYHLRTTPLRFRLVGGYCRCWLSSGQGAEIKVIQLSRLPPWL